MLALPKLIIVAIEGIYVGNDNAAKDTNEQDGQKATLQKLYRYDTKKMKTVELIVFDKFVTTTQMAILKDKSCQTIATRIKELQE